MFKFYEWIKGYVIWWCGYCNKEITDIKAFNDMLEKSFKENDETNCPPIDMDPVTRR